MTNHQSLIHIDDMMSFLDSSPVNFYAVETIRRRLEAADFVRLEQSEPWNEIRPGGKYYIVKNDSAIFAFVAGTGTPFAGFKIISAHSDSPGFRIKPKSEIAAPGQVLKLNTEVYGGPILYTWFDRPLSIAGRVILRSPSILAPDHRLVRFDRPLLTIPHLAIHFNRAVNEGNPLSKQKDMLPVLAHIDSAAQCEGYLLDMIAEQLGVEPHEIVDFDLSLYDTTPACLVGANDEFITSGRLDDLSMAYSAMTALLESEPSTMTQVMAIFDNEETGSGTKQGAASPELDYMLRRICAALGGSDEEYMRAVANSFMVSADNAHAIHPNHPELSDRDNAPRLNGGIVLKFSAPRRYATDGGSAAAFRALCRRADVPVQTMANRSDLPGGSTLGGIAGTLVPVSAVDIGLAQLAMHAAVEVMGAEDYPRLIAAMRQFYKE